MTKQAMESFAIQLYASLVGASPVDTGNMKGKIQITKFGPDEYEIVVSPGVFYAFWVNAKKYGPKQQFNYLWINKVVKDVAQSVAEIYGGSIDDFL
jgi:hypothetical protein